MWAIDSHMQNRPGRIRYLIQYKGLSDEFVREYCEDALQNKDMIDDVIVFANLFANINFDVLQTVVDEMNITGLKPLQCSEILNARPEYDGKRGNEEMNVEVIYKGKLLTDDFYGPTEFYGNPLVSTDPWAFSVTAYPNGEENEDRDVIWLAECKVQVNKETKDLFFHDPDGEYVVKVSKKKDVGFYYKDML